MAYLFLDGVWLKVRRTFGPQRVLLLVAYGVRRDDQRELLAFTRAKRGLRKPLNAVSSKCAVGRGP